jgi:hypothetical protein
VKEAAVQFREPGLRRLAGLMLLLGMAVAACGRVATPGPPPDWVIEEATPSDPVRLTALRAARDLGRSVNARLTLPRTIRVRLLNCGEPRADWFPEQSEIVLCGEIVEEVATALEESSAGQPRRAARQETRLIRIVQYLLAHELGRAVIDMFGVRVEGSEASGADEFAALFLLGESAFADAVLDGAANLRRLARSPGISEAVRDERLERAATLSCLWQGARMGPWSRCGELYLKRTWWWRRWRILE